MADIVATPGYFGSANSFGGVGFGVIQRQILQNTVLVVADATHGHTADGVTVTQQHTLSVQNALHAHTSDAVTVTQQHTIAVDSAAHALTFDNVSVIYNTSLAVSDAFHGHTVDNVIVTQQHTLVVNNASHALTFDAINISQQHSLVVNDTTHSLTFDGNLVLNQFLLMNKPDDSYHGLSFTNAVIAANQVIVVDNAKHILYLDSPGIINWADLEKYFGVLKPGTGQYGNLTPSELADIKALYSKLVFEKGSLEAVEIELGYHKKQYGETGELLAIGLLSGILKPADFSGDLLLQAEVDSGVIKKNAIDIGNFLSDKPLSVLMLQNGFAWLSEDGLYHITEEAGNGDKITLVSTGTFKQGNIEYGRL